MLEHSSSPPTGHGCFPATRWSVVLEAQDSDPAALARLCGDYWMPLYGYACRMTGDLDAAKDLTQGFFEQLLSREGLRNARQERGKLRTFLLTGLKRYSINQWRKTQSLRRGGGLPDIALDGLDAVRRQQLEPREELTPELEFDRAWARQLLDGVMERLGGIYATAGKGALFDALRDRIEGRQDPLSYTEAATALGISEGSLRLSTFKLRKRYRELLQKTIAETVTSPEELEDEIHYLRNVFAKP